MNDKICWQIYKSDGLGDLTPAASAGTLSAAARRIIDREALRVRRLVFDARINADGGPGDDAVEQLEFNGNRACYVVRRATK